MQVPDLTPALGPIPWAVVGAVATRLYMPERTTQDLDIAISAADAPEARHRLAEAGFEYQGELSAGRPSWVSPGGVFVDVLEVAQPWLAQALDDAQRNRDAQGLPIFPLAHLALMKFQAGRVQDLADVTRMLGQASEEMLGAVRRLFTQYAPSDLEDLESLILLGRMEMQSGQPDSDVEDGETNRQDSG